MAGVMRRANWVVGLCAGLLTSCGSTLGTVAPGFTRAAERTVTGNGVRIELEGEKIVRTSVPIDASELPEHVHLAVAAIQPRGRTLEVARIWTPNGGGHAVGVIHGEFGAARRRHVVVADDGSVLERSHEIRLDEVSKSVRDVIRRLGRGEIARVEVVQRGPADESYRFEIEGPKGLRTIATCTLSGTMVRTARLIDAELQLWE